MSFKDVIKNSVLEAFSASDLFTSTILLTIALSAVMGFYVYAIYRLDARSSFYSRDFNKTLALLPSITASIVLAMQSNLVVSLGMVGALSIVRFRNAVKNPSDLAYLFWSISLGILLGAQLYELTFFAALIFTAMTFFIDLLPSFRAPFLGGGVMKNEALFPMIRKRVKKILNGYLNTDEMEDLDKYIVPASLKGNQGVMGCIELARRALVGQQA